MEGGLGEGGLEQGAARHWMWLGRDRQGVLAGKERGAGLGGGEVVRGDL